MKKFIHFFLIGISVLVLLYAAQTSVFKNTQEVQADQPKVCTPGQFKSECTGQCGGCAADAGEAKVFQCLSDGSGFEFKYPQCETKCAGPCVVAPTPTPAPTTAPTPTPTPAPPAVCDFSGCGQNGCGANQRYVSGDKCWTDFNSWFRGNGCYNDTSCGGSGPTATPTSRPTVTPTPRPTHTPRPTATPIPGCVSNDSCSVSTPSSCGQTNTGVDNCNRSCSRSSAACAPAGGTTITNTNNNTNNNSQSQSVNVTQQANGNVGVAGVTTLPKTGLPALAWSALAFIPAGFGMRKFRGIKKTLEDNPQFIWENRQFKS